MPSRQGVTDTSRLRTVHNINVHVRYMYVHMLGVKFVAKKLYVLNREESECNVRGERLGC